MLHGQVVTSHKTLATGINHRACDHQATDGIGAVEDDQLFTMFGGGEHAFFHCRDVSVEAAADILDVVNQTIDVCELLGGGSTRFAVQRINGQLPFIGGRIADTRFVEQAFETVLGTKQRDQLHPCGAAQQLRSRDAIGSAAGVIGNQAHAFTLQAAILRFAKYVDAQHHGR